MGTRFQKARFHVSSGPQSLFDRVRCKMKDKNKLKINALHLKKRGSEREIPIELFTRFNSKKWTLMTAEVRTDTGKFVNSAWSVKIAGKSWWVVIGFNDTIETVIQTNKFGCGESIIKSGQLYEYVDKVNKELMLSSREK